MSKITRATVLGAAALLLTTACARTARIDPHGQSTGGHESAQASHEHEAGRHSEMHAAEPPSPEHACRPHAAGSICWTELRKSGRHRRDADAHRRLAAEHGRAARELTAAEERACAGLSALDRDESPFRHTHDITRVDDAPSGATIAFRGVPGLSAESLQAVMDCHLAQNAARGHEDALMPYCPLVPRGVNARVVPEAGGFAVRVTADDPATVREIQRRAGLLRSGLQSEITTPTKGRP